MTQRSIHVLTVMEYIHPAPPITLVPYMAQGSVMRNFQSTGGAAYIVGDVEAGLYAVWLAEFWRIAET